MLKKFIVLLIFIILSVSACQPSKKNLVIGSKNFTESIILAELFAQHIENTTGEKVDRQFNLGGTIICHQALLAGQIDIYPEYTGTALMAILQEPAQTDSQKVYDLVKDTYQKKFSATIFSPLGFNNTFAILVRREDAEKLNLKTISEVSKYTLEWKAGFGYEFMSRADGFSAFASKYNLKFKEAPKEMDLSLTYRALAEKQVDLIAGNSTDGLIASLNLFMLADDQNFFPPYQAVPIVNNKSLERLPLLKETLAKLAGKISESEIQKLNGLVDIEHQEIKKVVKDFLATKKF